MSADPQTTAIREVFTTSRVAEFCTRRELEKQTGHSAHDWPLYVVKELLDNSMDASEEAGMAPKVEIDVGTDRITVTDNGPGIATETVERLLDLGSRTSARAHYVSPTRGAQGQALSTLLVMPYALAPGSGAAVIIESRGLTHRIAVHINKLTGEPRLVRDISDGPVKSGTRVTVKWPQSACPILEDAAPQFLPLAYAYVLANPHLSLTVRSSDGDWVQEATDPVWIKWRACDPTSPHWYSPEKFGRLIAAYLQKDQETGRRRPLRDFLGLFDGLKSTTKRSQILADLHLNRASLSDLVCDGELDKSAIAALLQAMQAEAKPLKPIRLGVIGETHLRIKGDGRKYVRKMGMDANGLPYVIEGAFAWQPGSEGGRLLLTGANFASSPALSFKLGIWRDASDVLTQRHAGPDEPVVVFLHVTHPSLAFTDLGKTQLALPRAVADDLEHVIQKITADWHKQRQQEEKDAKAKLRRLDALERSRKITIKDSVYRHLPESYAKASGGLGARSRQIFYQLRPLVLAHTGRDTLESQYIEQTLIPDFIAENSNFCAEWTVFYDDRGHLIEPHTDRVIGLGTRAVRDYCSKWSAPTIQNFELLPPRVHLVGPTGQYRAILFCEKEGFNELFQAARLAQKYDIAIASTKGTSVTACRELFEAAGRLGIPVLVLHDFDYDGFKIAATLHQDTRRYRFEHRPQVIDIGLRLAHVARLGLQSEPVTRTESAAALRKNLRRYRASDEEITFLIDGRQRVELNAMSTPQLLELIETALNEHGVKKVIPDAETLAAAYRANVEYCQAQRAINEVIEKTRNEMSEIRVPDDLAAQVEDYLKDNPHASWEQAIAAVAAGEE